MKGKTSSNPESQLWVETPLVLSKHLSSMLDCGRSQPGFGKVPGQGFDRLEQPSEILEPEVKYHDRSKQFVVKAGREGEIFCKLYFYFIARFGKYRDHVRFTIIQK